MKYYDVTFHELSGKTVVKRDIPSEKNGFDVWKDACADYNENELFIFDQRRCLRDDESEIYCSN